MTGSEITIKAGMRSPANQERFFAGNVERSLIRNREGMSEISGVVIILIVNRDE